MICRCGHLELLAHGGRDQDRRNWSHYQLPHQCRHAAHLATRRTLPLLYHQVLLPSVATAAAATAAAAATEWPLLLLLLLLLKLLLPASAATHSQCCPPPLILPPTLLLLLPLLLLLLLLLLLTNVVHQLGCPCLWSVSVDTPPQRTQLHVGISYTLQDTHVHSSCWIPRNALQSDTVGMVPQAA